MGRVTVKLKMGGIHALLTSAPVRELVHDEAEKVAARVDDNMKFVDVFDLTHAASSVSRVYADDANAVHKEAKHGSLARALGG